MTELPDGIDTFGGRPLFYNRASQPVTAREWAELRDGDDWYYLVVAQTWVRGWLVSTAWLGIDYLGGIAAGPPLIFETVLLAPADAGDYQGLDGQRTQYATEQDAKKGHQDLVEALAAAIGAELPGDVLTAEQTALLYARTDFAVRRDGELTAGERHAATLATAAASSPPKVTGKGEGD